MARAKRQRTKHEGIHDRDLPSGRVYDINYRGAGARGYTRPIPGTKSMIRAALSRRVQSTQEAQALKDAAT